jgi:hypothetical protein
VINLPHSSSIEALAGASAWWSASEVDMPSLNPSTRAPWFVAAFVTGAATWIVPCAIGGVREAWDWSIGGFVLLNAISGFALGVASRRVVVIAAGISVAHVVCGFIGTGSATLIFPGSLAIAVLSFVPTAVGAAIGRRCVKTNGSTE